MEQEMCLAKQRCIGLPVAPCVRVLLDFMAFWLPIIERCSKIAEAEAAVSVNEKKWLVMHMHVQLQLDELRGPQTPQTLLSVVHGYCCLLVSL
jgi:hypothetical protein